MSNWQEVIKSDLLSSRDKEILKSSGFGHSRGYGNKPALLIVDAQYKAVGSKDKNRYYPLAVGSDTGSKVIQNIKILLDSCRQHNVPVFYLKIIRKYAEAKFDSFALKENEEVRKKLLNRNDPMADEIVEEIAPLPEEVVIEKRYPSGFFGTPLLSFLNTLKIDTILTVGFTTSGCVRATVVDAFSYNFNPIVVEDCVCDRIEISHKISLFDMHLKYADVNSLDDTLKYINALS